MSAAEKVHQLPQSPSDLWMSLVDGHTFEETVSLMEKALTGRHRTMLPLQITEWADAQFGRNAIKRKSVLKSAPNEEDEIKRSTKRFEAALRRAARAREARAFLLTVGDITMHEAWTVGGRLRALGKRGDKRRFWKVHTEKELAKMAICKS